MRSSPGSPRTTTIRSRTADASRLNDLAGYLATAMDAPVADGERIDIGWDRPLSFRELARIGSTLLGRDIDVFSVDPAAGRTPDESDSRRDFTAMVDYFASGRYVADSRRQAEVFGNVPTAEDAVRRRLAAAGLMSPSA